MSQERSVRPYRLWDVNAGEYVRWRCYASPHNAHDGIWDVMKWYSDPGRTLQLENVNTHNVLATYVLHFRGGKYSITWE